MTTSNPHCSLRKSLVKVSLMGMTCLTCLVVWALAGPATTSAAARRHSKTFTTDLVAVSGAAFLNTATSIRSAASLRRERRTYPSGEPLHRPEQWYRDRSSPSRQQEQRHHLAG